MNQRQLRIGTVGLITPLLAWGTLLAAPAAQAVNPSCDGLSLSTPGASQCDVPAGVTYLTVAATGAGGGGAGGSGYTGATGRGGHGAVVDLVIAVTPGETLDVEVGQGGQSAGSSNTNGAGGGGWTAVKRGATLLVVAGGGGGAGALTSNSSGSVTGGDGAATGTDAGGAGAAPTSFFAVFSASGGGTASQGGTGGLCTSNCGGTPAYNGADGTPGVGGGGADAGNGAAPPGSGPTGGSGWQRGVTQSTLGSDVGVGGGGGAGYFGGGGGAMSLYIGGGGGGAGGSYPVSGSSFSTASNGGAAGSNGGNGSISLAAFTPPAPPPPAGGGSAQPVTVTIALNANGGTGSVPAVSGDQGTWTTAPSGAGLSRPGFTFTGWNTSADGSGIAVAAGSPLLLSGDNTLFAQWAVDGAGGSGGNGSGGGEASVGALAPTSVGLPAGGLPEGGSLLTSNGAPVDVTVSPNQSSNPDALVITSTGLTPPLNMRLEGRGDDADPLGLTSKQALILQSQTVQTRSPRAKGVKVQPVAQSSGNGFKASSPVRLYILPNTFLGTLTTDASGAYSGAVPIPAGITPGVYTLQANGFAPDDSVRSLSIGVVVQATKAAVKASARDSVFFAPLSTRLTPEAKASLRALVKKTGTKVISVQSVGFVQPTASTGNDQALSTARARTVAAYLRSLGVKGDYTVRGDGRDEATGAQARRVDITITYTRR